MADSSCKMLSGNLGFNVAIWRPLIIRLSAETGKEICARVLWHPERTVHTHIIHLGKFSVIGYRETGWQMTVGLCKDVGGDNKYLISYFLNTDDK